jgi:hypothetical protein
MNYLIIGAGPCGLAMANALKRRLVDYDHVEKEDSLGGNWNHGVYDSVYTDACKDVMQFEDYPMPTSYPDFLSKMHMLEYLNDYARHFDLKEKIRYNREVIWVSAIKNNKWLVTFKDMTQKKYKGIIICNGHHWSMNFAKLDGDFSGDIIHSKDYKTPHQISNKRVLIIGSGNSAADIACEAARVSICSAMSMKDSPWIFPKSFMGIPLGRNKLKGLPNIFQPILAKLLLRVTFGRHSMYGLPNPRHKIFEKHPTVSEELPYYLKHGRIQIKPEVLKVFDRTVWFTDNSQADFDLIVSATGFNLSFPFLPSELSRTHQKNLECVGHSVYPDYKGLFFLGWQQARGGVGQLASAMSSKIVDFIKLEEACNQPAGKVLISMGCKISTTNLYGTNEILSWLRHYNLKRLLQNGYKLESQNHCNTPTAEFKPQS